MPRNTVTEQIGHTTIRNLGIASSPSFFCFFFSPQGGHGIRKILMDSHPYSHETSIFTLGAPHEEVQGRQTKLHPGFTMGPKKNNYWFPIADRPLPMFETYQILCLSKI